MFRQNLFRVCAMTVLTGSILLTSCADDPAKTKEIIDTFFTTLTQSEVQEYDTGARQLPPGGELLFLPVRTDGTAPPTETVPLLLWPGDPGPLGKTYELSRFMEFDPQGKAICPNSGTTCTITITLPDPEDAGIPTLSMKEGPDFHMAFLTPTEVDKLDRGSLTLPEGGALLEITRRVDGTGAPPTLPLAVWPADPETAGDKTYEIKRTLELDDQGNAQCPSNGTTCGLVIVIGDGDDGD